MTIKQRHLIKLVKKATEKERKAWRTRRNKLARDPRKAKLVAMRKKTANAMQLQEVRLESSGSE